MLRDFLRIVGAACIIAGAFLFFTTGNNEKPTDNSKLQTELQTLKTKLDKTEEELANLQTATSAAEKPAGDQDQEQEAAPTSTTLLIKRGMNSAAIADLLENSGVIEDGPAFELYLEKNGLSGKIQIGEYKLDSSMTNETIAAMITKTK